MKNWLVFDVGCIECGEPSGIIGFFDDESEAQAAADAAEARQAGQWEGQHAFVVIDTGTRSPYATDRDDE